MGETQFKPFGPAYAPQPGVECEACGANVTNPRAHELYHERFTILAQQVTDLSNQVATLADAVIAAAHVPPGQAKK